MQLGGPAGEVTQGIHGALDVHVLGEGNRFAHVDGFDFRQLRGVLLDQVGQALHHALAFGRFGLAPGAAVELGAGGLHGAVQVIGGAHGNAGDQAFGRRFDHIGSLAVAGFDPGAADEHFLDLAEEGLGGFADAEFLQVTFDDRVHFCSLCPAVRACRVTGFDDQADAVSLSAAARTLPRSWKMKPMLLSSSCAARIEVMPVGS
ncbi:hypothetical protein D3C84_789110 [compost metagenome]